MPAIATQTDTYTAQPFATVPVDGDAGDLLDRILTQLERDSRALGPVVGYDYERQRIDAIFQVEVDESAFAWRRAQHASAAAISIFDAALARCGLSSDIIGLSIVEGDDPDQLP